MKNKILKVIQVIYDILSLGFIVFVVCAMSFTPKSEGHSNNDVIERVETKSRYNYYAEGRYDVKYSFNVLCSDVYWTNFYTSLNQSGNESMILLGGTSQITFYDFINNDTTWTASSTLLSTFYFGHPESGSIVLYPQNDVYFTNCTLRSFRYLNEKLFYLHFDYVAFNNNYYVEFIYCFIDDVPYGGGILYSNIDNISPINVESVFSFPKGGCAISIDASSTADYDTGYSLGYQNGYDAGYDEREVDYNRNVYDEGFDDGYDNAVIEILNPDSEQYQYIYDLGKQEGIVEGMRGTESNAFIVIGQAFNAVGSIFSIEVLPNLPLWVLVFTPLIIVVVIVVVKLIKG